MNKLEERDYKEKHFTSDECFKQFNKKNIEMCFRDTDIFVISSENSQQCRDNDFCVYASWSIMQFDRILERVCFEEFEKKYCSML